MAGIIAEVVQSRSGRVSHWLDVTKSFPDSVGDQTSCPLLREITEQPLGRRRKRFDNPALVDGSTTALIDQVVELCLQLP